MTITTLMLNQVRDDVKDDLEVIFLFGAIGEGTTTPATGDTALELEVFRDAVDDFDKSQSDKIIATLEVGTTEANGNSISEAGWFDAASLQVDSADVADWNDSADITTSVNQTTYKEGEKSLNLTKDAGASATVTTDKTTTSRDFTSKQLSLWLYIKDAAALAKLAANTCLSIRFGSDSGNYYEWEKDRADLSVGWNRVDGLTSANADNTNGTPVIAASDYTYVELVATGAAITWSAGDFIMDDIRVASGNLWTRNTLTAITKVDSIGLFLDTQIQIIVTES